MITQSIHTKITLASKGLAWVTTIGVWLAGWAGPLLPAPLQPPISRAWYLHVNRIDPDTASLPEEDVSEISKSLLLPDLRTLPPSDLRIVHLAGGMRQLRLSNTIWNSGQGSLELSGDFNSATSQTRVYQHITTSNGSLQKLFVGEFVWHPGHDHWHFEDFTLYELWSLRPNGGLDSVKVTSEKLSYCVLDTDPVDRDNPAFLPHRNYFDCGQSLQGLSAGWGDTYKSHLDGQSLDITAIPDGYYALISIVNPGTILLEADYKNNHATVFLEIRNSRLKVITLDEIRQENCREYCWS